MVSDSHRIQFGVNQCLCFPRFPLQTRRHPIRHVTRASTFYRSLLPFRYIRSVIFASWLLVTSSEQWVKQFVVNLITEVHEPLVGNDFMSE
jgi:hypothetical protein